MEQEPFAWLLGLQRFGIKLGLDQMRELLAAVGQPHERLRFVHIAGTNGKGSVAALLASGCSAAGLCTGFYSSPHLVTLVERFRLDGKAIAEGELAGLIQRLRPAVEAMAANGRCPTFFEATTALAAMHFAERGAEMVIWETGMGGRFDATNVVVPLVSVITGIGLDHMAHLGDTETAIAGEKAGIIKPGVPVFCGALSAESAAVIAAAAASRHAPLVSVATPCVTLAAGDEHGVRRVAWGDTEFGLSLSGDIQLRNAALARAVLGHLAETLGFSRSRALTGFARVRWPARRQLLPDGTIVDGAHNPQAAVGLVADLARDFPGEKFSLVFGCLSDKDAAATLQVLTPIAAAACFVTVPGGGRQAADQADLAARWTALGGVTPVCAELDDALFAATAHRRLVTGSLYLAGAALARYGMIESLLDIY